MEDTDKGHNRPETPPAAPATTDAQPDEGMTLDKAKKEEDIAHLQHTPEHNRRVNELRSDIKIPADLSKVSAAKAKELAEAGVVEDSDLPGKMYKRKADGFVARIPDYTFDAYPTDLQEEWDEIKLQTAPTEEKRG